MILHSELSLDSLASQLSEQCSNTELLELIKLLDLHVAEYTFTKYVFEYFRQELINEDKENIQ